MAPKITMTLSGIDSSRGSFKAVFDKQLHLEMAQTPTLADIARTHRGCEALARALKTRPEMFIELLDVAHPKGITRLRQLRANIIASEHGDGAGSESDDPSDDGDSLDDIDWDEVIFIVGMLLFW
jgi:hypothetical protein